MSFLATLAFCILYLVTLGMFGVIVCISLAAAIQLHWALGLVGMLIAAICLAGCATAMDWISDNL